MSTFVPYNVGTVLSGRPSRLSIYGLSEAEALNNPFVPPLKDDFCQPDWLAEIVATMPHESHHYVFGPQGSGKTSGIKYVASLFRIPVYEVTGHSRLEFPELIGGFHLRNGETVWSDGPLTMALRHGGIFLLNEQSLLDPATAAGLNTILDNSPLLVPETGEHIIQHQHFRYIATDNTNGAGDESGQYVGVLKQNSALMSRFTMIKAAYPPRNIEESIIGKAVPDLPNEIRGKILDYVEEVRASSNSEGGISISISPRDYLRWSRYVLVFEPLKQKGINPILFALERAFLFRASSTDQITLRELFQRVFGG